MAKAQPGKGSGEGPHPGSPEAGLEFKPSELWAFFPLWTMMFLKLNYLDFSFVYFNVFSYELGG